MKARIFIVALFVTLLAVLGVDGAEFLEDELYEDVGVYYDQVLSGASSEVLVTRVIDGDTIEIETGEKVRYIGIDTPETNNPKKEVECYGQEAKEFNKKLVEGRVVRLEKDISDKDRYGRLLRYVWVGDTFVNEYLVSQGYAYASTFPPDILYQDDLRNAQKLANSNSIGLWENCEY